MSADCLKLDNALCFAIYSANHAITRAYKPLLDKHGLTYPQYLVMIVLWDRDGQTVGGIGDELFLESSTLTPLLKRLEAAGYVRRERDPKDERQVVVFLTQKGQELRKRLAEVPRQMLKAFGCGSAGMEKLRAEINAVRDNVSKAAPHLASS
ncbi:MarR family transcriptional regulator [Hyphomicrobium sp.]|uniref:MarR family winged helix-turn-helix transcriptional regulator n=1 Tax=Hyphomicrobium sp. TaxID=82 RepID=UPI0025BB39FC|nr:MarR family transcriptional regulator [Hyphomicrobium sp.]MCC7252579.1 MarR family transcriptional regulator [Hyphomicrobium sp.]